MTRRQWLERERRPDHCGINARAHLRTLGGRLSGKPCNRSIALNTVSAAAKRFAQALESI